MLEKQPLVSIIIPCYNHAQFIEESIQSVIKQDYKNIELIIIDDGSKDDSSEVINKMIPVCEARFSSFFFKKRSNKGLSATLNEAISLSSGEFIGFCSSDDCLHKNKTSRQVEYFFNQKNSVFCYTKTFVQDDNGNIIDSATRLANLNLSKNVSFEDIFTFKVNLPITGMYRANFIQEDLKGFDESLSAEDYDINLRILQKTNPGFIDDHLYYYRTPAVIGSQRIKPLMRLDVSESHRMTINKYSDHPKFQIAMREWNFRRFIIFSRYSNYKIYALGGLLHSFRKSSNLKFYKSLIRLIFVWK